MTSKPDHNSRPDADEDYEAVPYRPRLSGGANAGAFIGILLLVLSVFTTWGKESMWDRDRSAKELTSQILWDTVVAEYDAAPIMWFLVVAGLVVAVGLWRHEVRWFIVLGGSVVVVVPLLYIRSVKRILDDDLYRISGSITSHVGIGVWLCLVAGVVLIAAGISAVRSNC